MSTDSPYFPEFNPDVEAAIGRFIIAWGVLECQIDMAIHDLMLTGMETSSLVTANLAIKAKLDLAHALFEKLRPDDSGTWPHISAEFERRFDSLINVTAKANTESRIPIVHSQPQAMRLNDVDRPFWVRMAARKGGLRGTGVTYSVPYLDARTESVANLAHEWSAVRAVWRSALHGMRHAEADALLGGLPGEQDHLILQLQSIPDSQKASPKTKPPPKPSRRARRQTPIPK